MNNETERDAFDRWFYENCNFGTNGNVHYWADRAWQARAAISPASLEAELAAPPHFDVEAMLVACVPGGSSCDPQSVADAIREFCATHPPHSAPVAGMQLVPVEPTDDMVLAAEKAQTRHLLEDKRRGGHDPDLSYQGIYRAMLAAALRETQGGRGG